MPQRNVATNFTFEQQRQEINLLAADFWTHKTTTDTAAPTYLKHDGSNAFTGGTLNVPNAFTINANSGSGTLTISGNLDVTGTTTTVSTANLEVTDKNILIAKGSTSDAQADGAGITIDSATDITFNFVDAKDALVSSIGLEGTTFLKAPYGQFLGSGTPTTGQGVEINAPDTNTGQISSYDRANTAYKELRVKGSSVGIYGGTTNALVGTFNSTGLIIESGKNIGIGTASPTNALDVQAGTTNTAIVARSTDAKAAISFVDNTTTGVGSVAVGAEGDDLFLTSGSSGAERIRIEDDGKIKFITNATSDYLQYGNNPRVWLKCPSGINGLRIDASTTPLEIKTSNNDGKSISVDSNFNLNINADYSLAATEYDSSGKIFLNATRHNGTNTATAFQTSIQAVATSNANNTGYLGFGSSADPDDLVIKTDGTVGIGTIAPRCKTEVYDSSVSAVFDATDLSTWRVLQIRNNIESNIGTAAGISFGGDGGSDTESAGICGISNNSTGGIVQLAFITSNGNSSKEQMRIDQVGRLLVGTTDPEGHKLSTSNNPLLQLESADSSDYGRMSLIYNGNNGVGPGFWFAKSRGTSIGSNTVVQDGDQLGGMFFHAADGDDKYGRAAAIVCYADGTQGTNITPGKLEFSTTQSGAAATTARMVIHNDGYITTPTQVGFCARMSSNFSHPGNNSFNSGTNWVMPFDQEVWDVGSNFNDSNYTYTAPVTGRYLCCYTIQMESISGWVWNYIFPVVTGTGGNSNTTATTAAGIVFADDGGAGVTGGTQQVAAYRIDSKTFVMNLTAGQEVRMGVRGEMSASIKGATESQWTMQLLG